MERSLATADGAAAASPRITVTPLHTLPDGEHFGVKIQGLSLGALSEADWELVWVAWLKCEPPAQPNSTAVPDALLTVTDALLVFPDQSLTAAEEVAFYHRFPHRDSTAGTSVRRALLPEAPDIGLVYVVVLTNNADAC